MNSSRCLSGHGALSDCPGAHFIFAAGEKTDQVQQGIGSANEPLPGRLLDPDLLQERGSIAFIELRDFHFYFAGERQALQPAASQLLSESRFQRYRCFFFRAIKNHQQRLAA